MTEFEFFTDTDFTDRSILPIFDSLEDQNDYFDAQTKIEKEGNFKGFNNPIILFEPLETCISLSYFRFKINDKWYYAITTDVAQDTPGKTILSYRLDYWQTARYQFDIRLGRGYVSRSSHAPKGLAHRDARYTTVTPYNEDMYAKRVQMIYFRRGSSSTDNKNHIGIVTDVPTYKQYIFNGLWIKQLNNDWSESDILGAWFIPAFFTEADLLAKNWNRLSADTSLMKGNTFETELDSTNPAPAEFIPPNALRNRVTTNKDIYVITDMDGSIIYQFNFGRDYSENGVKGVYAQLDISPTSCCFRLICAKKTTTSTDNYSEVEVLCSLFGQGIDVFIDAEHEYFTRQRQFDMQVRANNVSKNITNSIGNVGSGAVEGALTGGLIGAAGGPIGAVGGAVIGGLTGVATSLIGGAIDTNYNNPREQEALDNYYKVQADTLSIVGSHLFLNCFASPGSLGEVIYRFGVYKVSVDPITAAEIDEDISTYGEYCTIATADGEDWLLPGALRGEFVIKGNVPESWKGEVQRNIASGVTITKYEV